MRQCDPSRELLARSSRNRGGRFEITLIYRRVHSEPVARSIELIARRSSQNPGPLLPHTNTRVSGARLPPHSEAGQSLTPLFGELVVAQGISAVTRSRSVHLAVDRDVGEPGRTIQCVVEESSRLSFDEAKGCIGRAQALAARARSSHSALVHPSMDFKRLLNI
jgi:hypothetical protein